MKWSLVIFYSIFSDKLIIVHTVFKQYLYNSNMAIRTLKKKQINFFH